MLGYDHFLCHFSVPATQNQNCGRASSPANAFPVVRDWEPTLLAARTELDSGAAAMQESYSEQVVRLPQRCATVNALCDDLVRILWDTATLCTRSHLQYVANVPNPDGGLTNVFKRWWVGMRRGETSTDLTSQPTMLVSPLVGSASTGLSKTNCRGCALRTYKRVPIASGGASVLHKPPTPHDDSMIWRTPLADTARPCHGWRDHFSSAAAPSTHNDFSSEFHCSMTSKFFELTSGQHSSNAYDAFLQVTTFQSTQQMPRFNTWAGRSSTQHFPTAPFFRGGAPCFLVSSIS